MILEVFGPSGAGKTTFTSGLVPVLRCHGYPVVLQIGDRRHPIRRAALKLAYGLHSKWVGQNPLTTEIFELLPPKSDLWATRLKWHFELLIQVWNAALTSNETISIFDQGMVQFVCSLVMFSGVTNQEKIERALDLVPKPNLLVRLQAPREILESRLRERQRHLGIVQRLLEVDLQTSLDNIRHITLVGELVESFGVPTISIDSSHASGRAAALDMIARDAIETMQGSFTKRSEVEFRYGKLQATMK
ncbi:MAG: hypothetical protein E5X34_15775 [Mesorhizobium sp.]|uniref:hypothetical protein n=1 Tax=Mesorhizobium sp. TaxID=1871066 RepID=UPI001228D421|nr:hypothetical protein [Mesorhizobium sp.]TIR21944.1 MAG: hypothetical protein E5X34_15775 [Mesorhizobium sp.]